MEQLSNQPEQTPERRVLPFSPQEALESKQEALPDVVIEVVNQLLTEKISTNGWATIHQKEVVIALEAKGFTRAEIYAQRMLDFENHYRQMGWDVKYDKPGYNESYSAYFEFCIAKQSPRRNMGRIATDY